MRGKFSAAVLCFVLIFLWTGAAFSDTVTVTTSSLPPAGTGQHYSQALSAEGNPSLWRIISGDLPGGLSLDSSGVISGTVSLDAVSHNSPSPDVYVFTVAAYNTSGDSGDKILAVDVYEPITIITESLPKAKAGVSYDAVISASGTNAAIWEFSPGIRVPGWLKHSNADNLNICRLSGVPDKEGEYTFNAVCANEYFMDEKTFTIVVAPEDPAVEITPESPDIVPSGEMYTHTFTASGRPSSWAVTSGDLPPGLALSSADGVISGIVSTDAISSDSPSAKIYSFDITASNDTKSDTLTFSITVYQPIRIITQVLPNATEGAEYSADIIAEGTRDSFSQALLTPGNLPIGISYSASSPGKITLTGTPIISGTYSITVSFTNKWGSEDKTFILAVDGMPEPLPSPKISMPKTYSPVTAGDSFSVHFSASGTQSVTWGITGDVPPGLSFDTSAGILSGEIGITEEGKYSHSPMSYKFTVTASGTGGTDSADMYIQVVYPPEIVTGASLPDAMMNASYSAEITASGTEQGMTWETSDVYLPEGLTLSAGKNQRVCRITGTPREKGRAIFTIRASNAAGSTEARTFTFMVRENSAGDTGRPEIMTMNLPDGRTGEQYTALLEASGEGAITWTKSGRFPRGLTLDEHGTISGIPEKTGTYTFMVTAANSRGSSSLRYMVKITGGTLKKPRILTNRLPRATHNQPYSVQLRCRGNTHVVWSFAEESYPAGIYITEDGLISGIPKEAGKFRLRVKAENNAGSTVRSFSLRVNGVAPKILNEGLHAGISRTEYTAQLSAEGTDPIKWKKSGRLPSGLKLGTKTGKIAGTPKQEGTYSFRITARNKYGADTQTFIIIITGRIDDTSQTPASVSGNSEGTSEAIPETVQEHTQTVNYGHEEELDLCVVSGDEELRGEIYAPEGMPLTFRIGDEAEETEIYIADEPIAIDVDEDGTFILPGELVYDEFVIYAVSDGVKTIELYIVAEPQE
ncbi:MAG: putative Ig domain-containing protein [Synergistaceae bacterium]|nr:putative Ig domain-containing protein [Synergistaceae bacterium]